MSSQPHRGTWESSDDLPNRLGGTPTFSMPDDWTLSTPWQRAQEETDQGGPINRAERMVFLSDSENPHRVTFALNGADLLARCDCRAFQFDDWCSHVASLWWQWVTGEIIVHHLDTGRAYPAPPCWLSLNDCTNLPTDLTPAELDAYLACDIGGVGVREFARHTDRRPGTVGNLLSRARDKMGGQA